MQWELFYTVKVLLSRCCLRKCLKPVMINHNQLNFMSHFPSPSKLVSRSLSVDFYARSILWRKMYFWLVTSAKQRKILSPLEESNLRPSDLTIWCSTTEPQRLYSEQGPLWSRIYSYTTLVLYTARIGNVADPSSYYAGHIFFVPCLWQDEKYLSLFLYQA